LGRNVLEPTDAALYWAGFLMADGYVSQPQNGQQLGCGLALVDKDHVQKLCDFVGRGKVSISGTKGKPPLARWGVYSQPIITDLERWGIVSGKGTLDDASPKGEARLSIDFWRGMIDGDGSIRMNGRSPQVTLTGRRGKSEAFIEFVVNRLQLRQSLNDFSGSRLGGFRIHEYPTGGGTKVILNGKNAVSLCKSLYANAPDGLYLQRKRNAVINMTGHYLGIDGIEKFR
jgi:hypothetical protein